LKAEDESNLVIKVNKKRLYVLNEKKTLENEMCASKNQIVKITNGIER